MGILTDFKIETFSLTFSNTDVMTIWFTQAFSSIPTITANSVSFGSSTDDDVNVYVEAVTLYSAVIRTSSIANVSVHVQVIGT
ncbi:MAG: hypothetical protein HN793_15265 [Rhodospirillaceae bacterium]|jgi:hypothetical protein|nr:hypothetical protein [Rhodospirillaceae bacterium]